MALAELTHHVAYKTIKSSLRTEDEVISVLSRNQHCPRHMIRDIFIHTPVHPLCHHRTFCLSIVPKEIRV